MTILSRVRGAIAGKLDELVRSGALPGIEGHQAASWTVERPKRPEHGDYSTNVAMVLAKPAKANPRGIAETLAKALVGDDIASADVAGPGFLNLRVRPRVFHDEICTILSEGAGYGRAPSATDERIDIEFVSANPTGPLPISAARNAILGDAVARALEASGCRVVREYYVNDFGNQVRLFAESVVAVAEGREVPEDGYRGEYVRDLAEVMKENEPALLTGDRAELARHLTTRMLGAIRASLASLGVHHDVFFSEEALHRWGRVDMALARLEKDGFLEHRDGAVFFVGKGAASGDKDRVVKKSDGAYTYFAGDVAYFADKVTRGYDRLITVLGVDHHGYEPRIKNVLEALGMPSERCEILFYNLVYLLRDGQPVRMGKRAGNIVTVDEVLEEIDETVKRVGAGRDAVRFFFLSRSSTTNVDFDIALATKQSLDNPVFYVQYGHARMCSILRKGKDIGLSRTAHVTSASLSSLIDPDELALASKIGDFPLIVAQAADYREPHRLVFYVQELARDFQSYATRHKSDPVLPPQSLREDPAWQAKWDTPKTLARLAWIDAVRTVYASALALVGVSAPEQMFRPDEDDEEEKV